MTIIYEYEELESVMSNLDHSIDEDIAKRLKAEPKTFAQYSGWDFCGYVYWDGDQWQCEVWTYKTHIENIKADDLQGIMDQVCGDYGSD